MGRNRKHDILVLSDGALHQAQKSLAALRILTKVLTKAKRDVPDDVRLAVDAMLSKLYPVQWDSGAEAERVSEALDR